MLIQRDKKESIKDKMVDVIDINKKSNIIKKCITIIENYDGQEGEQLKIYT